MLRVVKEVRPSFVFIENSPLLARSGLGTVLEGLAQAGYDAAWTVLGADDVEAQHIRKGCGFSPMRRTPDGISFFHTPTTKGLDGGSNSRKALCRKWEKWPPPQASDFKRLTYSAETLEKRKGHQEGLPERVAHIQLEKHGQIGGKLNPEWVEWLMG